MSKKKLAKVFYADLWGTREEKFRFLEDHDISTTPRQELRPTAPYHFFVPRDFSLQAEYEKFWKLTKIFREWASGVKTHRDRLLVGFNKGEVLQRLTVFTGNLPSEFIRKLRLRDTRDWKLEEARKRTKLEELKEKLYPYAYRAFDKRWICYELKLIDRGCGRWDLMKHLLHENVALATSRKLAASSEFHHAFIADTVSDMGFISSKTSENSYFFPLHLYNDSKPQRQLFSNKKTSGQKRKRVPNLTVEFLKAIKSLLGTEPSPEEIFYYIYAVLYYPTYRERYKEFLKIDFPRIPLPPDYASFKELSCLGKELVDLHLLKHPALNNTGIGFPESGSYKVRKVQYDEKTQRVHFNQDQYFEGIPKEVWEYRIGAYRVMEKYLKDRKGRELSRDESNRYMKMAKALRLTIHIQRKIDSVYNQLIPWRRLEN